MKKNYQLLFTWVGCLLAFLSVAVQVAAQSTTSSAVQGIVKNNNDEPMPGASVTVTYAATGSRYQARTSEKGTFYLQNLPVGGPYKIEVSFLGYRNFVDDKVYLALGQAYNVKVYMSEEKGQLQQVEVKGNRHSSPHDASKTGAGQNISRSQLDRMPTLNRSLSDFTRLVPQSSGLSFGGRNNRYNNIQIDGSQNNDIMGYGVGGGVTTGAPGGQAGTQPISLDAIDEIQVVLAPFDVKQGSFTGAGINAVTRRGTNTWSGSVYAYGKNQGLMGLSPDDNRQKYNAFQDGQLGFRLGGAIVKNKLFFFVNGETSYRSEPLLYRAGRGKGAADESTISYNMAQQLADTLRSRFGYEPGKFEDITKVTSSNKFFIRLDYTINDRNRLTLRHNFVNARRDDITNGANALRFENNKYIQTNKTNVTVAELNTYFSENVSNNLIVGYTSVKDNREIPGSPFPQVTIQAGAAGTLVAGTEGYSPAARQEQNLFQLTDNLSWLKDKHHFTFGTQNEYFRFDNLFLQNVWGNYQYSSLDAFLNNQAPNLYQLTYSKLPGVSVPPSVFRSLQLGFYAQDEYTVMEGLKITAGLRADIPVFLDKPLANPQVAAGFINEGYKTDMRPKTRVLLSPRLGFNWDINKNGNTIIRGGTGIFTGRLPYVWLANAYNNTGVDLGRINATGAAAAGVRFNSDVNNQPRPNAVATSEIDLTDPNFRMPQVWRTSLAVDQQLPWQITGTLEAIYSKDMNAPFIQDLNLVEPKAKLGGDGRDQYPAGNARLRFPEYTNVFLLTNTNKGYQYSLTAKLERNVANGVSASAAYTYGQAKDISSMNSTIASTNFRNNTITNNPNYPQLTYSDWNLDHRIIATLSYRVTYLKHLATTIGLVYNGQSGLPYTYRVNADINGDGQTQNDAMYIPKDISDIVLVPNNAQDKRTPQEIYAQLNSFIEQDPYLSKHRGEYAGRNAARTPWTHIVDLHVAQDVLLKMGKKTHALQIAFDVFNFTNMLNRNWGLVKLPSITTTQLPATLSGAVLVYKGMEAASPAGISRPMYSYVPVNGSFVNAPVESRWRGQLSVRYSF
ncbi:TonB-dependent receptor [Chitinophaga nivalis]|uniref:Carboxypeptidase regulatory-like domain-containing protein n=1 Tax=Chitinophaga nivalis TaxID=2991709 RepID=A0ABT3IQV9_9BACT|nr:carboxypeptidase regulatory-like domain-containing protein [Chitinophaga nivalis]MCW3463947.1 carboxypeptidase regulatory-like domain-containing protein [Chitinophaga nivalis]MCW3486363.1 carboxypeptidase regulatory-like domain-containing protein [Chitinophaga nivalis]